MYRNLLFVFTLSMAVPQNISYPVCPPCNVVPNCKKDIECGVNAQCNNGLCEQLLFPWTVSSLSILLLVSEILPFMTNIKANGLMDAMKVFVTSHSSDLALAPLRRSNVDYGLI